MIISLALRYVAERPELREATDKASDCARLSVSDLNSARTRSNAENNIFRKNGSILGLTVFILFHAINNNEFLTSRKLQSYSK
jgi:hypothetical protein